MKKFPVTKVTKNDLKVDPALQRLADLTGPRIASIIYGGTVEGPATGYKVKLHGIEFVQPLGPSKHERFLAYNQAYIEACDHYERGNFFFSVQESLANTLGINYQKFPAFVDAFPELACYSPLYTNTEQLLISLIEELEIALLLTSPE